MVKTEIVSDVNVGGQKKRTINVFPEKGKLLSYKAVISYVEKKQKENPNMRMLVRGMNILRATTLKGLNDLLMTEKEYAEYTNGKVEDNDKFKYFTSLQIVLVKNE